MLSLSSQAHEVQAIFPNIPINVIRADLTRTHSVDITTDNILEGNIHIPVSTVSWQGMVTCTFSAQNQRGFCHPNNTLELKYNFVDTRQSFRSVSSDLHQCQ